MSLHRAVCVGFLALVAQVVAAKGIAALNETDMLLVACAVFGLVYRGRS